MQRFTAQTLDVIWPLMGRIEFLWIIVTFAFTILGAITGAPAKAPADKNSAAKAAESVKVFSGFVILLSHSRVMR